MDFQRYAPLEDLVVRSEGNGRTIEAYAAVFGVRQEIRDRDGHYVEELDPATFDRTVVQRAKQLQVVFNHGLTIHGTPSERFSMPYGRPVEVKPDKRGLWTVTEVARTELGDEVLELANSGVIRGMSFGGKFLRTRNAGRDPDTGLPIKVRTETALREFGATPFPYYVEAQIVGIRAELVELTTDELAAVLSEMDDARRNDLVAAIQGLSAVTGTSALGEPEPDVPSDPGHAVDSATKIRLAVERDRLLRKDT